ncbi:hypothetical protein [Marinobacterium aestuariivivens]|uniref:AsmA domain-containing protein n=1 Tax=Marinobacterium aestuariivivens TaxID=1698799 RepID=A0ABW2A1J2_9GAMM
MTPAGDYPLALSLDWLARLPDYGELRGQGTLRGQLRGELVLTQELQGLAQARLEARVTEPLTTPAWQLALELIRFDPAPFAADLAGHEFSGRLDFSGDLASARGGLSLNGSVPEAGRVELISTLEASVEQLQLSDTRILLPDTGARVSAAGRITALQTAPELDLQLDWEGLRYPLPRELPAQFSSDSGQVQIQGPLQDYRLRLSAALAGEQIPESDLELEGQGNLDGFSALTLDIASLGGELRLDGNAGWRPQPAWKLRARASNIDPGRHWPDWTGSVGFELNSEGWLEDGKPRLQADIAALSGQLRGQPLSGTGQLRLSGTDLEIPQLALGWGNARLEASGRAGETLALNWRLQAPDLASLLPDTGGSISASGTLTGPRRPPRCRPISVPGSWHSRPTGCSA